MSFSVLRLENKPIIVSHLRGVVDSETYMRLAIKTAALADDVIGKVYLVIDLTLARMELMDTVDVLAQMTRGWRGTPSDPRIITMLVCHGGNPSLVAGHLAYQVGGWRRVFLFTSMAQALACACGPILVERDEAMSPRDTLAPPGP